MFDHWPRKAPEISFQWELRLETFLHVSQFGIQLTLVIHLSAVTGFEWVQAYFSIINRNTLSPWSSSLPVDLMVHNNSQDENIPLLTEVWPWPMSRELSVRHYFGTYLQTSTKSLFWLMYFFTFGKSTKKILRWSRSLTQTFMLLMLFTCSFVYCVCKLQIRSDIFQNLLQRLQITHISSRLHHLTAANPHYLLPVIDCAVRMHLILGAEIYNSSKNIWPYKYTVHLWEW